MKTKQEIEKRLQEVEAKILNMEEARRASETVREINLYTYSVDIAIKQAKLLKWVLE